jgi:hypothetical protein
LAATGAHAQADSEWLEEALSRAPLLSAPWESANRLQPEGSPLLTDPWGSDRVKAQKAASSHSEDSSRARPTDAVERDDRALRIVSVDALPYPWPDEPKGRLELPSADGPPVVVRAPIASGDDSALLDPFVQTTRTETAPVQPMEVAQPALVNPWDAHSPSWVPPSEVLVDPWGDG